MESGPLDTVELDRQAKLERTLALARAVLALLALVLLLMQLPLSAEVARPTSDLIIAYNVYALAAAVLVELVRRMPVLSVLLHAGDMLWAVLITTGIEALADTSSVFFLFVLVSAAYRWGLVPTIATAVATALLQSLGVATVALGIEPPETPLQQAELLTWSVYLVGLGCLIGYLADEQNRSRLQAAATARLLAAVDLAGGLGAALQRVMTLLFTGLQATSVVMLFEEHATGRAFRWSITEADVMPRLDELTAAEREKWLFPVSPAARAWRLHRRAARVISVSDVIGRRRRTRRDMSAATLPFDRCALVAVLQVGGEWTGRLIVLDPARRPRARTIDWLATLAAQLGPALYTLYLLRRLRSRVTAVERTRLARELHDGLIQTLVGIEMQIEVLRRGAVAGRPVDPADVLRVQEQLHGEVINARELMQRLQPLEINPADLPGRLADLVERFRRDTAIEAQFVTALDEEPDMSPRLARELVRIAQEALANIRKHSGASRVIVRFGASAAHWTLAIDDNGRGFEHTGRHTLEELDRSRRGPVLIKERVRGIRGALTLDSLPGRGTLLEIEVPRT